MAETAVQYEERLDEIAHTSLGVLSDDQVLQLLAERKQLQALKVQYEQAQKEQTKIAEATAEKVAAEKELARLNTLISPDKPDDELIHLIEERKAWEAKLAAAYEALSALGEKVPNAGKKVSVPVREEEAESAPEHEVSEAVPEATPTVQEAVEKSPEPPVSVPEQPEEAPATLSVDKDFGEHRISEISLDPDSELGRYLGQIENDPENIGKILDNLPVSARRDKVFMLGVAEIDPAYAMHYADKDTLKKDEDFNLRVVSLKGKRTSGSVLAEMLPEARTEAVVMAALKQDYRNIRYALPQMAGYDQMLEKAKKAALDKVKELKDSVDVMLLVPKILQKDKAFMEKVEKLAPQEDK